MNLHYVSQVERLIHQNINNWSEEDGFQTPGNLPSYYIIEQYLNYDLLSHLETRDIRLIWEIYRQIKLVLNLFDSMNLVYLQHPILIKDKNNYIILTSTILSASTPLLNNMFTLWISILKRHNSIDGYSFVEKVSKFIKTNTKSGKNTFIGYKSSYFKNYSKNATKSLDAILCWIHDYPEFKGEVLVLEKLTDLDDYNNSLEYFDIDGFTQRINNDIKLVNKT